MQVKVCFEEQKERFGFLSSYPKDPFLGGRGRQGQGGISICFHMGISVWVAFSMNSRAHWTLYSKVLQQQAASVAQVSEHSCTSPYSSYSVVRERGGVLATVAGPAAGRGFLPHLPAARPEYCCEGTPLLLRTRKRKLRYGARRGHVQKTDEEGGTVSFQLTAVSSPYPIPPLLRKAFV